MSRRYFTVEEANGMIPTLESAFAHLLQMQGQIRTLYERLAEPGFAPEGDDFVIAPEGAPRRVVSDLASLRTLVDAIREQMRRLHQAGCVVKGLEAGLVDWYAREEGREIFLCWKLGEKKIGWSSVSQIR